MKRISCCLLTGFFLVLALASSTFADEVLLPIMPEAPKLDGKVNADEWRVSAVFDGFQRKGTLARRRVRGYVGATKSHIHIAIVSQLPDKGKLKTEVTEPSRVVRDDAVEVLINAVPKADKRATGHFLSNSKGLVTYVLHAVGNPDANRNWRGDFKTAHGFHDGRWHFECSVPIAKLPLTGDGRTATDGLFRINLCRDWKEPWEWSSLDKDYGGHHGEAGYWFNFVETGAPAVRFGYDGDPFLAGCTGTLTVVNPSKAAMTVKASIVVARDNMFDIRSERALTIEPGADESIAIELPEVDQTTRYDMTLRVTSPDGKTVYYSHKVGWPRKHEPYVWEAGVPKQKPPVDTLFAYYPSRNLLRLLVDVTGLPKEADLERAVAIVRDRETGEAVKTIEIPAAEFTDGVCRRRIELPPLEGRYTLAVRGEGEGVPEGETVRHFERRVFPWENLPTGDPEGVYPPFTPMEYDAKTRTLSTVLRDHTLNGLGLCDQVEAEAIHTGVRKPILAAPMRLVATVGGREIVAEPGELTAIEIKPHRGEFAGSFEAGALRGTSKGEWEVDGCLKYTLTLAPTGGQAVEGLRLEIPLRADAATHIHANADRIRAPVAGRVPEGEGVVWDASKVVYGAWMKFFCPYVYVGTPVRGLCWFAENDRGWGWEPGTSNLDIVRRDDETILRIHLINRETTIDEPRTLSFGMMAAPAKPRLVAPGKGKHWWRYRFERDNYDAVTTNINWMGGHRNANYPAMKDLYLWEMMARGNRRKLDAEVIDETADRFVRHLERLGVLDPQQEDRRRNYRRVVRHNLRGRYGNKMIFYTNRACNQPMPEYETFQDEWATNNYRVRGEDMRELKVVPSRTYIDYTLYWNARSFEVGNNKGQYWDNFFIYPTYNVEMTEAYRRDDGTVVPAAGLWRLRELCKRTFIMQNEREMLPVTMPHMTSFAPLPLLSFATMQYDWEWKFGQGDVQDRFTRDYILLVTSGELTGAWPILLKERAKSTEWQQRTFTAVKLVHELDGYCGWVWSWNDAQRPNRKLAMPVLDMLDREGLKVYRYWDERPQPVRADHADLPTIVYSVPGEEAMAVVTSYADRELPVTLTVDAQALGFEDGFVATDVETEEAMPLANGRLRFDLKKHDLKVIRLRPVE